MMSHELIAVAAVVSDLDMHWEASRQEEALERHCPCQSFDNDALISIDYGCAQHHGNLSGLHCRP